jgi:ABC-type lipoprotein release transport system permease subunit
LSQAESLSALVSSVDERVAGEVRALPGVDEVDGMLYTNALLDDRDYLFVFGYDPEGFAVDHFRIVEGQALAEARRVRGKPILLGRRAADSMDLGVGDTLRFSGSAFRIVGIYETGSGLEDGAVVLPLEEAQSLALQPRRVSVLYLKLSDPGQADEVQARIERRFPDLAIATSAGFADQEQLFDLLDGIAVAISGLAVLIGGITMTNTLWMSVFERTREIGVLRSLGWRRRQVLGMIVKESLALGGLCGIPLGLGLGSLIGAAGIWGGAVEPLYTLPLFVRAVVVALVAGTVGGLDLAWPL